MNLLVPFLIAYLGSELVFRFFDFNYDIFNEPFSLAKLLIDIGVFGMLFIGGSKLFDKYFVTKWRDSSQ